MIKNPKPDVSEKQVLDETLAVLSPKEKKQLVVALAAYAGAWEEYKRATKGQKSFGPGEVYQAALNTRLARGGDISKPFTQKDYDEAIKVLQLASVSIKRIAESRVLEAEIDARLEQLKPFLKKKELSAGMIEFGRAVKIITGVKHQPTRQIGIFRRACRKEWSAPRMGFTNFEPLITAERKLYRQFPFLENHLEYRHWTEDLGAKDVISLREFAALWWMSWPMFKGGRAMVEQMVDAELSAKKVLVSGSGHATRKRPKRAAKKRT